MCDMNSTVEIDTEIQFITTKCPRCNRLDTIEFKVLKYPMGYSKISIENLTMGDKLTWFAENFILIVGEKVVEICNRKDKKMICEFYFHKDINKTLSDAVSGAYDCVKNQIESGRINIEGEYNE